MTVYSFGREDGVWNAADEAAMLALDPAKGDLAIRADQNSSAWVFKGGDPSSLSNWQRLGKDVTITSGLADTAAIVAISNPEIGDVAQLTTGETYAYNGGTSGTISDWTAYVEKPAVNLDKTLNATWDYSGIVKTVTNVAAGVVAGDPVAGYQVTGEVPTTNVALASGGATTFQQQLGAASPSPARVYTINDGYKAELQSNQYLMFWNNYAAGIDFGETKNIAKVGVTIGILTLNGQTVTIETSNVTPLSTDPADWTQVAQYVAGSSPEQPTISNAWGPKDFHEFLITPIDARYIRVRQSSAVEGCAIIELEAHETVAPPAADVWTEYDDANISLGRTAEGIYIGNNQVLVSGKLRFDRTFTVGVPIYLDTNGDLTQTYTNGSQYIGIPVSPNVVEISLRGAERAPATYSGLADTSAVIALSAKQGDVATLTDGTSYVHNGGTAGTIADWTYLVEKPAVNLDKELNAAWEYSGVVKTVANVAGGIVAGDPVAGYLNQSVTTSNIALASEGGSAFIQDLDPAYSGQYAAALIDQNTTNFSTGSTACSFTRNVYAGVNLGSIKSFSKIGISPAALTTWSGSYPVLHIEVSSVTPLSADPADWTEVCKYDTNPVESGGDGMPTYPWTYGTRPGIYEFPITPTSAQYVRIRGTGGNVGSGYGILELEVHATGGAPAPDVWTEYDDADLTQDRLVEGIYIGDNKVLVSGKLRFDRTFTVGQPVYFDVNGNLTQTFSNGAQYIGLPVSPNVVEISLSGRDRRPAYLGEYADLPTLGAVTTAVQGDTAKLTDGSTYIHNGGTAGDENDWTITATPETDWTQDQTATTSINPINVGYFSKAYSATTTDATPAVMGVFSLAEGSHVVRAFVTGRDGTADEVAGFEITAFIENTGGTCSIIGTNYKVENKEDSSWDADITVSGANVQIQVTGDATNSVEWKALLVPYNFDVKELTKMHYITTDNTPVTIGQVVMDSPSAQTVNVIVTGRDLTSGDSAGYEIFAVCKYHALDQGTIVGDLKIQAEEDSTWDASVSMTGRNINIVVTGDAANPVEWKAFIMPLIYEVPNRVDMAVETYDDTQTLLGTVVVPDDSTTVIKAHVAGMDYTTSDTGGYDITAIVECTGGTSAIVGSINKVQAEEDSSWDVTVTSSGRNINLMVTGDASNAVEWKATALTLTHVE